MAQVQEERMTWARRCRLYARQRPVVLVIGAVVVILDHGSWSRSDGGPRGGGCR